MSIISKSLSGIIFNADDLELATADFKGNLNQIFGFDAGGDGYTLFKPTSTFNSLTKLSQDGIYIVDAHTTGFELPGASQVVVNQLPADSPAQGGALTSPQLSLNDNGDGTTTVELTVTTSERTDVTLAGQLYESVTAAPLAQAISVTRKPPPDRAAAVHDLVFDFPGVVIRSGHRYTAVLTSNNGNALVYSFTA